MFLEPISPTAGLASGRPGRWSEEIEAVKIGSGAGKAATLCVFVSTMAPGFNTAGLAFACSAASRYSFTVLDYAWVDPGEPIKAGQTSSSKLVSPDEGSLSLLAAGAGGLVRWRQRPKCVAA